MKTFTAEKIELRNYFSGDATRMATRGWMIMWGWLSSEVLLTWLLFNLINQDHNWSWTMRSWERISPSNRWPNFVSSSDIRPHSDHNNQDRYQLNLQFKLNVHKSKPMRHNLHSHISLCHFALKPRIQIDFPTRILGQAGRTTNSDWFECPSGCNRNFLPSRRPLLWILCSEVWQMAGH